MLSLRQKVIRELSWFHALIPFISFIDYDENENHDKNAPPFLNILNPSCIKTKISKIFDQSFPIVTRSKFGIHRGFTIKTC